jgi:prostaglandin-endoperoxide synthase 2
MTPSRLRVVLVITAIECASVYGWLRLDHAGHTTVGILVLVLGELLESSPLPAIFLKGPADPAKLQDPRVRAHLRRVLPMAFFAIPAEILVWLTWRWSVDIVGLAWSIPVLLVLMHLKHQMETSAVRGRWYEYRFFDPMGTLASAYEVAGAVGALALIRHDEPWLALAAVVAGIGAEHWVLIGKLQQEMRERDLCLPAPSDELVRLAPRTWFWRRQGFRNSVELWGARHNRWLWALIGVSGSPFRSWTNRFIINRFAYRMRPRPDPLSTMSSFTSWVSLTDRTYSARHLPPADQRRRPPVERVEELFHLADEGEQRLSRKSTLLFPHFAQWFTDGFLHTDPNDARRNTSTHDIDLSQLYGQTPEVTRMLRGPYGTLKHEVIDGRQFPPRYFGAAGEVKPEFRDLELTYPGHDLKGPPTRLDPELRQTLFALALPRGNIHYGLVMMSTVFLREHNRLAAELRKRHREWSDDEVFQTARNTLIVMLLKIVIRDYINHISPLSFKLFWDLGLGVRERWFRENWMSVEFDLLYRWHALVPREIRIHGEQRPMGDLRWDNRNVTDHSLAALFDEASNQPSAELGLLNTPDFLWEVERRPIQIGRDVHLGSYNDYREACRYPRVWSFNDISTRADVVAALEQCYPSVEDIDLYVGLFAEDVAPGGALPELMGAMVGCDAFTQALTNPLLSETVFGEQTFSAIGLEAIKATDTLSDLVCRNVEGEAPAAPRVDFTQQQ